MHGILNLRPKEADQLSSPSVLHVFAPTTSTTFTTISLTSQLHPHPTTPSPVDLQPGTS